MKKAESETDQFIERCLNKKNIPILSPEVVLGASFEEYDNKIHNEIFSIPLPVKHLIVEVAKINICLAQLTKIEEDFPYEKIVDAGQIIKNELFDKLKALYKKENALLTAVLKENASYKPGSHLVLLNDWKFTYTTPGLLVYDEETYLLLHKVLKYRSSA